jgi:hypothetical protein
LGDQVYRRQERVLVHGRLLFRAIMDKTHYFGNNVNSAVKRDHSQWI